jgi:hypothetical protein
VNAILPSFSSPAEYDIVFPFFLFHPTLAYHSRGTFSFNGFTKRCLF